ncbi:cytochrome b [Paenirhodobacter populi]|uniref:cytochrome b n=1 Tax=Paenirhodobacter populi TaxID=2306993 RepID=UPI000FE3D4E2|nr:cytochrome b [Sinirhodobacter populi]RWR08012.1 cytochrome b [Sinirhodobacter populi]
MIQWRDTPQRYGAISRALHWGMAALLLWQFVGMGLRLMLGRTPLVSFFVGSHTTVGFTLAVLIMLRGIWALMNLRNRPPHGAGLLGFAAWAGHLTLYLLMAVVPGFALLRAWGQERAFAPYGIEIFPPREAPVSWAVEAGHMFHGELAWVLGALILGHIVMVAVHTGIWRDGTFARMAGRRG